jgi:hypothetical protein
MTILLSHILYDLSCWTVVDRRRRFGEAEINWHDSPLCKRSDHSLRLSHSAPVSQIKAVNFSRCLIFQVCCNVAICTAWKPNSSPTKHVVLHTWNTFLSWVCLCVRVHRSHYSDCAGCRKGIFIFAGGDRDILLYRVFMPAHCRGLFFQRQNCRGVKLITHIHQMPRFRMRETRISVQQMPAWRI